METRDKDNGIMNIRIVDITSPMLCSISEDTAVTLVSENHPSLCEAEEEIEVMF